ncbi:hypothetical protein [Eubacterium ventriosum]|uniref:hypothetical protein n=1 Tax=Eubacterium ventriosum TaxID=39496 RepID=UPI003999B544
MGIWNSFWYILLHIDFKPTKDEGVFKIIKANTDKEKVDELLDALLDASEKYIWFYHPSNVKVKIM